MDEAAGHALTTKRSDVFPSELPYTSNDMVWPMLPGSIGHVTGAVTRQATFFPRQQRLYFLPEPHGQGALRPTDGSAT